MTCGVYGRNFNLDDEGNAEFKLSINCACDLFSKRAMMENFDEGSVGWGLTMAKTIDGTRTMRFGGRSLWMMFVAYEFWLVLCEYVFERKRGSVGKLT